MRQMKRTLPSELTIGNGRVFEHECFEEKLTQREREILERQWLLFFHNGFNDFPSVIFFHLFKQNKSYCDFQLADEEEEEDTEEDSSERDSSSLRDEEHAADL